VKKLQVIKGVIRKRKLKDKQNNGIANPVYTLILSNAGGFLNCFISYTGVIVLSVLLRFMDSDYLFGIFKLFLHFKRHVKPESFQYEQDH
jgi:hypothetical protein